MKVTVNQRDLAKAVETAVRFTSKRSSLPVLENVLLEAFGDTQLKVAATNLEMSVALWIPCRTEEAGSVTLPGRLLGELVKALPEEPVVLELNRRTVTVSVRCGGGNTNIKGIAAEDFPGIPDEGFVDPVSFNSRLLGAALEQVVFATASDESRPALTGVNMAIDKKRMTLAATDGFMLAVRGIEHQSEGAQKVEIIVSRSAVAEVMRILKGMDDEDGDVLLSVSADGNRAVFAMPDAVVACQLVDADYPNFRGIIPKRKTVRVEVDRKKLEKALSVVALFSRGMHSAVKMDIDGQEKEITVFAVSAETGDGKAALGAEEVEGVEFHVMFNVNYVRMVLGAIGSGLVLMEFDMVGSPVVFRPSEAVVGEWLYVVMPMNESKAR